MFEEITQEDKILYCCAIANLLNEDEIVTKDEKLFLNDIMKQLNLDKKNKEIKLRIEKALKSKLNLNPYIAKIKNKSLKIMILRSMLSVLGEKKYFAPIYKENILSAVKDMGLNKKICNDVIKLSEEMFVLEDKVTTLFQRL